MRDSDILDDAVAICSAVMRRMPDVPIALRRGRLTTGYRFNHTPAGAATVANQWCVQLVPGPFDVTVAGLGPVMFGVNDNIGEAVSLSYADHEGGPMTDSFGAALAAAIQAKAAEVAAARPAL